MILFCVCVHRGAFRDEQQPDGNMCPMNYKSRYFNTLRQNSIHPFPFLLILLRVAVDWSQTQDALGESLSPGVTPTHNHYTDCSSEIIHKP